MHLVIRTPNVSDGIWGKTNFEDRRLMKITILSQQKCKLKSKCSHCFNCAPLTIINYYAEFWVKASYFGKEKEERKNAYRCILVCSACKESFMKSVKQGCKG